MLETKFTHIALKLSSRYNHTSAKSLFATLQLLCQFRTDPDYSLPLQSALRAGWYLSSLCCRPVLAVYHRPHSLPGLSLDYLADTNLIGWNPATKHCLSSRTSRVPAVMYFMLWFAKNTSRSVRTNITLGKPVIRQTTCCNFAEIVLQSVKL